MYVVNGSDGRCLVAVRLIVGVRYLERPLREVLLYTYIEQRVVISCMWYVRISEVTVLSSHAVCRLQSKVYR